MSTAEMLSASGQVVSEARNANDALSLLATNTFDVLLTDVTMPGMSGLELAVEAVRRCPDLRIVFASGHHDVQRPHGLSKAIHLRKPYTGKDLLESLRNVIA
jgi:YesN/AraC family two-component response regulator